MKNLLLCAAVLCTPVLFAQPSFQTSLQTGISLPLNSNGVNSTHAGYGVHFGNHLDYTFGNSSVRFGIGAYVGYLNTFGTDDKYKQTGQQIAEKYNMPASQLVFSESAFKSTQLLLGPVASFKANNWSVNLWAKGGYGLNEPGTYSVLYRANGVVNNVYINQAGDNKNGLAYNMGAGLEYNISYYVGLQLSAGYFGTQTDQVNYNFDREKGIAPLYYNAKNNFLQASVGLNFTIGKDNAAAHHTRASINTTRSNIKHPAISTNDNGAAERPDQKIKTKSNIKNDRLANSNTNQGYPAERPDQKIKTKSNIKNDRLMNNSGNDVGEDEDSDSLFFVPSKVEIRNERQTPKRDFGDMARQSLSTVNNYLTGFAYQTANGTVLNQCGSNAMPGDPVPGIDVRLRRTGDAGNNVMTARTNKDGSFAFNNIEPGNYQAEVGNSTMEVVVTGNNDNGYRIVEMNGGACSNTKENYVISIDDKLYVEVITARETSSGMATGRLLPTVNKKEIAIDEPGVQKNVSSPRDAATGMATGKRMHKPFRVADTDFDVNWNNIVKNDGKLYAEVITSREASSGMASGRSLLVTGDVDGDGIAEQQIASPRDAATGMASGRRMHKPFVVVYDSEDDIDNYEIIAPGDAASGMASGKRMHKPFVITKEVGLADNEMVSPRDAATGLSTGRRMHKPFVVVYDSEDGADRYELVTARDAASGMASGKRMHKPFVVRKEMDATVDDIAAPRDAASGMASGRRMHKPFVMMLDDADANGYEVVAPRDIATGQSSGRRQHQPISFVYDGVTYSIIHRDLAARKFSPDNSEAGTEKMAITEQGLPKKGNKKAAESYDPWNNDDADNDVVSNPLYQGSGNSGVNPLFEAKNALRVSGSNGKDHDIFIPSSLALNLGNNAAAAPFSEYEIGPIKWMSPESMAERKGWDGTVKGGSKNINTSESGLGGGRGKIKEGDPAAKSISEKGIKKNEVNIGEISRIRCADGSCAIETIVEIDGKEYDAVVTGVLKTKHDTAKNSIGNIR